MADEKKPLSREEDYRDYAERDVDDGWPYADEPGAAARPVDNVAYGGAGANFDRQRNEGYRISRADETGLEHKPKDPVLPETDHREDSDQLEADVTSAIEMIDGIDPDAIDVHADGHTVTLTGAVDTAEERRMLELAVLAVPGVAELRNQVTTLGVDTHIPADADE
ncbi:BON domain-containing protein [Ciceribacter sp. L1K23]|uniref:BON domain-containing protein n=1 Tax=unclassified Ciceribacter TaxID=2628820 RepID=UPI001ABDCE54|nr:MULTISPECIES: BON domain-containing protein [unclassified Ciceribacter]MBO3760495.1 BON domain-containing protein [Ciceribacter sp. L1K22]MBR0555448.1 BON domain-containing protein [Ciceribacter sp. L1K23]